jgi:hypothetical protein
VNVGLIDQVARYCLDNGYQAVLDGIMYADSYGQMLTALAADHRGLTRFYYLEVSLPETLARHVQRPEAAEFGPELLPGWYRPRDLLTLVTEDVVPESSSLAQTVTRILADTGLPTAATPAGPGSSAAGQPANVPVGTPRTPGRA